MSETSAIEWTDATWNPTTGCTKVSPGCAHCYIERTTPFRVKHRAFERGMIPLELHRNRLDWPYRWKDPKRIFVNSLSDLFHEDVPFEFVAEVFTTMAQTSRHTYQVLTKRPERLHEFYRWNYGGFPAWMRRDEAERDWLGSWRNVWFGVSVENRAMRPRIDVLRQTPAALRFLSCEPLLEDLGTLDLKGIRWVIVGGESGPNARPFDLRWARRIIGQCYACRIPVFVKQLGDNPYDSSLDVSAVELKSAKGGDPREWPEDLRVREFPGTVAA